MFMTPVQRALATSIGSLAVPFGCIVGMALGPFFVSDADKVDRVHGRKDLDFYMLICAFTALAFSFWIIFYKEEPRHFPSSAAKTAKKKTEFSLMDDMWLLLRNKNYILMTISFCMLYGVYTCLGAIINTLVSPYGFTSGDTSVFGATCIVSGLVGSFIIASLLDKYKKFLLTIRLLCLGSLLATSLVNYTLPSRNMWLLEANIAVVGFFVLPIFPVGYSFSVELTYPVSEAMSNGGMMLFSQLLGVGITFLATVIADKQPLYCCWLFMAMMAVALVVSFFVKEDLRRLNMERELLGQPRIGSQSGAILPQNTLSCQEEIIILETDPNRAAHLVNTSYPSPSPAAGQPASRRPLELK